MPTRLYPCICQYRAPNRYAFDEHRKACVPWLNRSHPDQIQKYRSKRTKELQAKGELKYPTCKVCKQSIRMHAATCPKSRSGQAALDLLKKNEMDPLFFCRFLRVLSKAYGDTEVDESVFCLWAPLP